MAGRSWSCEHCVLEFKDLQASALSVDCLGKWALLAGRKCLAFVDLDQSKQTVMKVTRQSKWDIGCVQWNRHASHAYRFVTSCNQRLDVFDFREGAALHLCSLKAHSRNVSDIDWSPFDVNIVASCSVDTFTYLWDVRDAKKPVKIFQTVSGAYQVKWNKVTNNLFATTHDGDIRIWDPRKGNSPVHYISAHPSKIHGLDWSHSDQYKLVTASQDCTIRFWDYTNPRRSEALISSKNPVWRARYTPFGVGVMSVVLPQLRRGENSIYLWSKENESPIHTFVGHKDIILEFQWRKQMEGSADHHLVTWSRDQSLRIWKVDPTLQKLCGHDVDDSLLIEDGLTLPPFNANAVQETFLDKEIFKEINSIPSNTNKTTSIPSGLSVSAPQATTEMNGTLEMAAPRSSSGNKLGEQEEAVPTPERKYTVEKVKVSSQVMYPTESYQDSLVPFPRTCGARFCSNDYLVMFNVPSTMKKVYEDNKTTPKALSDLVAITTHCQWMRPSNNGLFSSTLFYGSSPQQTEGVTISDWFTEKHSRQRHHRYGHRSGQGRSRDSTEGKRERDKETDKHTKRLQKVAAVKVYNISSVNPVNKYLAENYIIDLDDIKACCEHNAKVANQIGRKDLVQLWTTICHMSHPKLKPSPSVDHGKPWAMHPFGRNLVEKLDSQPRSSASAITTYTSCNDSSPSFEYAVTSGLSMKAAMKVLEDAMVVQPVPYGVFHDQPLERVDHLPHGHRGMSPIAHFHPPPPPPPLPLAAALSHQPKSGSGRSLMAGVASQPNLALLFRSVMKGKRSMSWSESGDIVEKDPQRKEMEAERILHENNCKMLNPDKRSQYEQIKLSYANILYKWQLLNQRTQVLKHTVCHQTKYENEHPISCSNCSRTSSSSQCDHCTYLALNCSICHVGVRGTANVCLACGHGGHSSHMLDWFSEFDVCPTGCGCNCLEENKSRNFD